MNPPQWITTRLANFRGRRSDNQPIYRLVWGPDCHNHLGWPRYMNPVTNKLFECWILERSQPHELFGTREDWEKDRWFYDDIHQQHVDVKGTFPPNDGYVMICPITNGGEKIELTEDVLQSIYKKIRADEEFAALSYQDQSEFVHGREEEKQRDIEYQRNEMDGARDEYYKTHWGRINRQGTRAYSVTPR